MRSRVLVIFLFALPVSAWENHALLSTLAVAEMPELKVRVKVETLESFLNEQKEAIAALLSEEEIWALQYVLNYPPRPAFLAFSPQNGNGASLKQSFLAAMRVNPKAKFALYIQKMPGERIEGASELAVAQVTLLPNSLPATVRFVGLKPGQMVLASQVFATATDEPDYGLDIKVWTDSGTDFGRRYGLGPQPFGNAKLEYGTQAPLHMGFYHEAATVDWSVSQITRGLPEYRIHQFYVLARLAFKTKHAYWGWRFAGMGDHYLQDLTNPYHAKLLPGGSTWRLLYTGFLDQIGIHGPKEKVVLQASDEHLALEKQVYCEILKTFQPGAQNNIIAQALQNSASDKQFYRSSYVRNTLTAESYAIADEVADALKPLPGSSKPGCSGPESMDDQRLFGRLMKNFGDHTRGYIRAILH